MWSFCCIRKYSLHMHTEKTQYTYCSDGPILYVSSRIGIQIQFTSIYTRFGVQIKHGLKLLPSGCVFDRVCVQLESLQEEQQDLEQTVQQYDSELCAAAEDLLQIQREVAYARAHAESLHEQISPLQDVFEEIVQVTVQSACS